ncbi:MAG TPA: BREX-4 system phosphatase PglZ [bacterium]|nr:BREX-4 system phosphatase PglZ [bacterium]
MPIQFESVGELLEHLRLEKKKGEPFATRFILIQGCEVWDELIPRLNQEVDGIICLSKFCSAADVFPNMERLKEYLAGNTDQFRDILLTPLAEYIRLDAEGLEAIRWLAKYRTDKINRIYVPLLASDDFFQSGIIKVPRYHVGLLPDVWALKGKGSSEVIVAPFQSKVVDKNVIKGIREYLLAWSRKSVRKAWLVTQMAPWLSNQGARGECRVHIYMSSFDYVRRLLKLNQLRNDWGSPGQWDWLALKIKQENDLDSLACRLLKVVEYDSERLFYMWKGVHSKERWLIWLWSKVKSAPGTYLFAVIKKNSTIDYFHDDVATGIFVGPLPPSLSDCRERKSLLRYLDIDHMPQSFWINYKALAEPLKRLSVLTDISQQEREEAILCIGELLTANIAPNKWWDYLECAFPCLAWYLQLAISDDEFVDLYFRVYTRSRVKDNADKQLASLIDHWASEQLLWKYPTRNEVVSKLRNNGARIMWVDGMGMEWMGLLSQYLVEYGGVDHNITVARSNLPTTTEANREWEKGEMVERGLDDIAHHYDYSFPESFLKAMAVIEKVASKAVSLLAQHPVVAITSDHGLSRFATKKGERIEVPEGLVAEAPGRFASLERENYFIEPDRPLVMDKGYVIWLSHGGFRSRGPCRGEIHGGATPEECLIPVVVVRKTESRVKRLPKFEVVTGIVKLGLDNRGLLKVRSDKVIGAKIELRAAGYRAEGAMDSDFLLLFELKGWGLGEYRGSLFYANQCLGEIEFELVRGIQEQDLGL